jgi:hypothetical protein
LVSIQSILRRVRAARTLGTLVDRRCPKPFFVIIAGGELARASDAESVCTRGPASGLGCQCPNPENGDKPASDAGAYSKNRNRHSRPSTRWRGALFEILKI